MSIRLIIASSENVNPPNEAIDQAVRDLLVEYQLEGVTPGDSPDYVAGRIIEVVCGCAVGLRWAAAHKLPTQHERISDEDVRVMGRFCARQARNRRMAERGAVCVAFWDGLSQGTPDLVTRMVARRKPVNVVPFKRMFKRGKQETKRTKPAS